MTREKDSDSTLPPEGKEKERGITTPPKMRTGEDTTRTCGGGSPIQPMVTPAKVVCSFCGVATHGYRGLSCVTPVYKRAGRCPSADEIE